jgi:16S rRNA (cytidine1402-2'-O)-methyltransferase
MPGTLYVVATPIGNLEDITLRALRVLRQVDLIACEDTRQTAKLLSHYQIEKASTSYHEHNEAEKTGQLLKELEAGKRVALVSDAGTPCISDPGYRLVSQARDRRIPVIPIPGACSFIAALSASGRATHAFTYLGFLPARKKARETLLNFLKNEERTLIFFESPKRLLESLTDLRRVFGLRPITIARELTKIYEEIFSGTPEQAIEYFGNKGIKGEIVLIVEAAAQARGNLEALGCFAWQERVSALARHLEISKSEAIKRVAHEMNVSRRELYQLLLSKRAKGGPQ